MRFVGAFTVLACFLTVNSQCSAGYLFPMYPTYSAGYPGWYGYTPAYAYSGYGYSGCGSGCGVPYSVSYAGCCSTGCCNAGCGTGCCSSGCGVGGCGISGCQGSCGGACAATETRKEAVPDPGFRDRSPTDDGPKTFEGSGYDKNPDSSDSAPNDDFGSPVRNGSGGSNSNTDRWDPSREKSGSDGTEAPFDFDTPIPGREGFGGSSISNKPPVGPETNGESGAASDSESQIIDRSANKPPINLPVEEEPTDAEASPGVGADSNDIVPPEDSETGAFLNNRQLPQRDLRSSHFGILSLKRLARGSTAGKADSTRISTSQQKEAEVRWISLPAPIGQVRS